MNLKSMLVSIINCGFATFLFLLVSPAENKSRDRGGGGLPGGNRPTILKPLNKSIIDVSRKAFDSKEVVAFPAGAYVGGKIVNKVNFNPFLILFYMCNVSIHQQTHLNY